MVDQQFGGFRALGTILAGFVLMGLTSCSTAHHPSADEPPTQRQRTLLDADWTFHLGDIAPDRGASGQL